MTQESNKFPTKTTIGAGILLLLFWHGKGFGFGKVGSGSGPGGESKGYQTLNFTQLGLVPAELRKMLLTEPGGTRLTGTVQLIAVQRGASFTGRDTAQDFVLAKSPGNGEAMSMAELLEFGDWFRNGKLNLIIRSSGAILQGNMALIRKRLSGANIPFGEPS